MTRFADGHRNRPRFAFVLRCNRHGDASQMFGVHHDGAQPTIEIDAPPTSRRIARITGHPSRTWRAYAVMAACRRAEPRTPRSVSDWRCNDDSGDFQHGFWYFSVVMRARVLLSSLAIIFGAVSLSNCGGRTNLGGIDDSGPQANAAGTGGTAGTTGAAGTTGGAGTTGTAAGGTTMSGGAAGSGGSAPSEICKLPRVVGPCDAAFPAWWHDSATGVCEPFIYGGCGGNANNFTTLEACQNACSGGDPDMDACSGPGECVLLGASCCGPCDPATVQSFVAVNRSAAQAYSHVKGCDAVDCGPCMPVTEPERTRQNFVAACEQGRCVVVDIRTTPLTECRLASDCRLRDGAECCEGCDGQGIVAINRGADADLAKLVCTVPMQSCPPCVPPPLPGLTEVCTGGRCNVGFLR